MERSTDLIRDELAEAELDDGLLVFGWLMALLAIGLVSLVQGLWPALAVVPGLAAAGVLLRARRQRELQRRLAQQFGLDWPMLAECARLTDLSPVVQDRVSQALRLWIELHRLARDPAWAGASGAFEAELQAVRDSLMDLLAEARTTQRLHDLIATCRRSLRHGERLAGLQARLEARLAVMDRAIAGLEAALAELGQTLLATSGERADQAAWRERLSDLQMGLAEVDGTLSARSGVE